MAKLLLDADGAMTEAGVAATELQWEVHFNNEREARANARKSAPLTDAQRHALIYGERGEFI